MPVTGLKDRAADVAILGESLTNNKIIGGTIILLRVYLARQQ